MVRATRVRRANWRRRTGYRRLVVDTAPLAPTPGIQVHLAGGGTLRSQKVKKPPMQRSRMNGGDRLGLKLTLGYGTNNCSVPTVQLSSDISDRCSSRLSTRSGVNSTKMFSAFAESRSLSVASGVSDTITLNTSKPGSPFWWYHPFSPSGNSSGPGKEYFLPLCTFAFSIPMYTFGQWSHVLPLVPRFNTVA